MTARDRKRAARASDARTERWLETIRTGQHDSATFQGASDIGVMPGEDTAPLTAGDIRDIGYRTWDKRPAPPPLPAHWDPEPAFSSLGSWRDHTAAVRCDYPAAPGDITIPCGAEHRDPHAMTFRGLWRSAQAAGWHLDTFGRRVCPDCQMGPEYRTLYPVAIWAARTGGDVGVAEHELLRDVLDTARRGRLRRDRPAGRLDDAGVAR